MTGMHQPGWLGTTGGSYKPRWYFCADYFGHVRVKIQAINTEARRRFMK
jgi:hypothetical protein